MRSVEELLDETAGRFERRGIASARLDAELLLAAALGMDRARLLGRTRQAVPAAAAERLEAFAALREARKPVAYILGRKEFWSLDLEVSDAVLVPRPETELVVEASLKLLPPAAGAGLAGVVVDAGTGAGPIALALARERPDLEIHATDVSEAALGVARRNAERLGLAARVRFHAGDLLEPVLRAGQAGRVDLVASNPPYVARGEAVDEEVRLWEPEGAVYGGASGLEVIERLLPQAAEALRPGGRIVMEMSPEREAPVRGLLSAAGSWDDIVVWNDLAGRARVVTARRVKEPE